MSNDDYAAARELFRAYDGSRSFMHRDGVEEDFLAYEVPLETERAWFNELLQEHLAALTRPGNWRSVSFLKHHGRCDYLEEVVAAEALGEWWERCSFFEQTLGFVEYYCRRHLPSARLADICASIAERAAPLAATMPIDQPANRVRDLVAHANAVAAVLSGEPGEANERNGEPR